MSDDSRVFTARLEEWRVALGLGHNAFARHLGISHGYWHQLRTGDREPSRQLMSAVLSKAPEPWRSAFERAALAQLTDGHALATA